MEWTTTTVDEFDDWFGHLLEEDQDHIIAATKSLEREGPTLRFPLSYPIKQPNGCDMRELRPASTGRSEIRILYAFDKQRQAVLLLGGDKAGKWDSWYDKNVPIADERFDRHRKIGTGQRPTRTARKEPRGTTAKERQVSKKTFAEIREQALADPTRAARIAAFEAENERAMALEELRRQHKVTQDAIARLLGVSQRRVSAVENQEDAQFSTVRDYLDALGYGLELVAVRGNERIAFHLGKQPARPQRSRKPKVDA